MYFHEVKWAILRGKMGEIIVQNGCDWNARCKSLIINVVDVAGYSNARRDLDFDLWTLNFEVWTLNFDLYDWQTLNFEPWTLTFMIGRLWTLNLELWLLGLVLLWRWFVDKRHVGTHGSCVRSKRCVHSLQQPRCLLAIHIAQTHGPMYIDLYSQRSGRTSRGARQA